MDLAHFNEMKPHPLFGARVEHAKLNVTYLNKLDKKPISCLYADFCGSFDNAVKLFELDGEVLDVNRFTDGAVIGITVCARSPVPSNFTNDFVSKLQMFLVKKLQRSFEVEDLCCEVYGTNMRMATVVFKLEKKTLKGKILVLIHQEVG